MVWRKITLEEMRVRNVESRKTSYVYMDVEGFGNNGKEEDSESSSKALNTWRSCLRNYQIIATCASRSCRV